MRIPSALALTAILCGGAALAASALQLALGPSRLSRWRAEVRRSINSRWELFCDCGSRRAARSVGRLVVASPGAPWDAYRARRVRR